MCFAPFSLQGAFLTVRAVLQIHRFQPSSSAHRGGHLVPDWPCPRAAKRCKFNQFQATRQHLTFHRSTTPNLHTGVCLIAIRITQRSSSSSAGCIISKALASPAKNRRLSTWRSLSIPVCFSLHISAAMRHRFNTWQTTTTRKVGTSWADVTCHSRSTPRHTRPTNKLSTVMAGTRLSGAPSASCITRSTSTATHSMRTPARYASTRTFPRSGTTLALW